MWYLTRAYSTTKINSQSKQTLVNPSTSSCAIWNPTISYSTDDNKLSIKTSTHQSEFKLLCNLKPHPPSIPQTKTDSRWKLTHISASTSSSAIWYLTPAYTTTKTNSQSKLTLISPSTSSSAIWNPNPDYSTNQNNLSSKTNTHQSEYKLLCKFKPNPYLFHKRKQTQNQKPHTHQSA